MGFTARRGRCSLGGNPSPYERHQSYPERNGQLRDWCGNVAIQYPEQGIEAEDPGAPKTGCGSRLERWPEGHSKEGQ